ncbi:outer membrane beta-barrel family protein [Reichenbachiella agariperforans]|uniref:outer membrane beta-barrel family protein n=1 Tax=Reichenbachiella agariperforans TaxID=156994 RepID=UPI001C09645B|nr:outer membrane beta-barrel family protein [Reichenbachiella agariperforans]MBU2914273.1 TonB-dependent receptor family protein [Reichenbachiella agariperforans]
MKALFLAVFTTILFSIPNWSIAATEHQVRGKIIDASSKEPLAYATASIHDKTTNELVDGQITQESGTFQLQVKPGSYYLEVKFISYETKNINFIVSNSDINLGDIMLTVDSQELEEVVVQGRKEQVEFSLDKKTFNVNENISNIGKNASDILDNLPSVQVDVEGNVSLRGNDNVNILINGKPSGMAGMSSQDALRMLQGNMIERVEVITNPSARYDAEGTGGIINIVLKEDAQKGLNGTFGLDAGYPDLIRPNASINYRSGKFNFFAGAGLSYRRYNGYGESYTTYYETDTTYATDSRRDHDRGGISQNYRVGADYFINDNNKLTLTGIYNVGDETNNTTLIYHDFDVYDSLRYITNRDDTEQEDESLIETSLNYEKTFSDHEDHKLTAYLQYRDNSELEQSDIDQVSTKPDSDVIQKVRNDEGEKTQLAQVDYIHPFSETGKFELGIRTSLRNIRNDYLIESLENEIWVREDSLSNDFEYQENIYAAYAIYGNKFGKISYQLGLRVEATNIETTLESEILDDTNTKKYVNYFPSGHFTYEMNENQNVQLSYSRRLRRPSFRNLNPISGFSDYRNLRFGNPDLNPELTDSYELGYLHNWETGSFYGGIYYNHTTDEIDRLTFPSPNPDDDGVMHSKLYNLATEDAYGFEINVSQDFTDWWTMNGDFNFFRRITAGEARGESFDADARSYSARVNTKFDLPQDIDFQANLNYRGPQNTTQGKRLAFYTVDLGATRDFFDGKATLTASVQDLFNTRKYRNESADTGFESSSVFQWRSRQFILSFTYRLNQKKSREDKQDNSQNNNNDGEL